MAISEAMATALPVISTRHAGIPEHVIENVTGFLTDEGDVEGMAAAMTTLLENPERAAEMGRAARDYALENLTRKRAHRAFWQVMDLEKRLGMPMPEHLR